jgi:hypothetical protein
MKDCFSFMDLAEECEGWDSTKPVFVDVGGGTGQQCVAVRRKWPGLPGRVVLQDLPAVVAEAEVPEGYGIEVMAYDFFTPQPVKGKSPCIGISMISTLIPTHQVQNTTTSAPSCTTMPTTRPSRS